MKSILVSGDLIRDYSLVRSPRAPSHFLEPVPHTLLQESPGGAWYLRDLIALSCADLDVTISAPSDQSPSRRAYTIWSPHPKTRGDKTEVWRVEDFLGCEPSQDVSASGRLGGSADLLVLDDLALDFRGRPELWPSVLGDGPGPNHIVLKNAQPLGEGALWDHLLERFADRLTLVIGVNALRARGAAIQDSISWDLAIEQTARELEEGNSALDLGRCRRVLVGFGAAGVAAFRREGDEARVRFERFVYQPELLESTWNARSPGRTFGALSMVVAPVVRHLADPGSYPLFLALARGLTAIQIAHLLGGGSARFDLNAVREAIGKAYLTAGGEKFCFSAFRHDLLADPVLRSQRPQASDLIRDMTGVGIDYVGAKATEIVLRGPARSLAPVPRARYGGYLTTDRQEIERINDLRGLIQAYQHNPADRRPFSLAVFGQPGSGKSFAVKQLAAELFPGQQAVEKNLAQWDGLGPLHSAFHEIRDLSLQGQTPLVFWDEFDSGGLRWLEHFLMPMQDAKFQQGTHIHNLGRAIFVFAGGTCADFETFSRVEHPKRPDFVSRLRTSLNIKGPNPGDRDPDWLIRRALLLRTLLERHWPGLIDQETGVAAISPSVIRGFLRVERYLHGARSLEMIVTSSRPGARFEASALPGPDLLRSHASDDFSRQVAEGELEQPVIEALAEACHQGWLRVRTEDGWRYGAPRDDAGRLHPMLKPYAELGEEEKEKSRVTARLTNAKLLDIGYRIVKFGPDDLRQSSDLVFSEDERTRLMEIEHDIWLRDRLLQGYEYAPVTNEALRLHRDLVSFQDQLPEDRRLDQAIVDAIPGALRKRQYKLVRR